MKRITIRRKKVEPASVNTLKRIIRRIERENNVFNQ